MLIFSAEHEEFVHEAAAAAEFSLMHGIVANFPGLSQRERNELAVEVVCRLAALRGLMTRLGYVLADEEDD